MKLYQYQKKILEAVRERVRVAFYLDMGLGKTFVGSEKADQLNAPVTLIVCQKAKVRDWIEHYKTNYPDYTVVDLTKSIPSELSGGKFVGVINYDLIWRRPDFKKWQGYTLILDESSLIQNEQAKRSKYILNLNPENVILLSGTPTGGKYERLWSQMKLLGWKIGKDMFFNQYVDYHYDNTSGFPLMVIDGYKNVKRLKEKMRDHGCIFMKTEEAIDLPEQTDIIIPVEPSKLYKKFRKGRYLQLPNRELIGDTTLTQLLYERQLCGLYSDEKIERFRELVESTDDRLIVFYNFTSELEALKAVTEKPISIVNGAVKDLTEYENSEDSVTFIQYQAGAMGLNLQKANKVIYFTPPLSSELYEQSKKRIHRVGQEKPCFYYQMRVSLSVEARIYKALQMRADYTERLFEDDNSRKAI